MTQSNPKRTPAVVTSAFALLSALSRTFIDYHVVYAELNLGTGV